jgi:hypothetical protein
MYHVDIPSWFLLLSLFLPRLSLFILWREHSSLLPATLSQPWSGILWFCIPRLLVLMMINMAQGMSGWFWLHVIVATITFFSVKVNVSK